MFDTLLCTVYTKGFYDCFYGYFQYEMNKVNCDKVERVNDIINNLNSDKNATDEEFQNFMHRVTEVGEYHLLSQMAYSNSSINSHVDRNVK